MQVALPRITSLTPELAKRPLATLPPTDDDLDLLFFELDFRMARQLARGRALGFTTGRYCDILATILDLPTSLNQRYGDRAKLGDILKWAHLIGTRALLYQKIEAAEKHLSEMRLDHMSQSLKRPE
jgi:hypothetical protein